MNIAIPTYKRANGLLGVDYFPTAKYVLPESQRDDYRKVLLAARMIVIPDEHDGNLCRKRNWILENIGRPVLMVDDDVKGLIHCEKGKSDRAQKHIALTSDEARNVIINGFNLAHQWGCRLWGINVNTDGRNYQQYKPISLSSIVNGPFTGHLEHDFRYDERFSFKEDYDFSLQVLRRDSKILRLNKYAYDCKHAENYGGMVSYRSFQAEVDECRRIEKKWGREVISYSLNPKKPADILNGRVNVPIAGV